MSRLCVYFKGGLIRIMWRVSGERRGKQLGDLLRSSGGPSCPPAGPEQSCCGVNTLRQCLGLGLCPSLTGCPSRLRVPGGNESEDCRGALGSPPNMIQQRCLSRSEDPGDQIRAGEREPDQLHESKRAVLITTIPVLFWKVMLESSKVGKPSMD